MADNTTLGTMSGGDVIATDDISGVKFQRVKATFGSDGTATDVDATHPLPVQVGDASAQANVLGGDTGQSSQLVAGNRKELSFSTTTAGAPLSADIGNYRWVSVHIVNQGTGSTITFQGSNDNTNWVSTSLIQVSSNAGPSTQSTTLAGAIYHGHCPFRYFRLSVSGISAGTTSGVVEFFAVPMTYQTTQIDVWELPNAAALADGTSNPTTTVIAADGHVYNGTSWDRTRSATAADGTSGTGLAGTVAMFWDGSKYVRTRPDNGLPVSCAYYETTASGSALNANVIPTVDVRGYSTVAVQLTFTGTATVTFQASNDGATWYNQYIERCDTPNAVAATATASGIYACSVRFRYLRAQISAYTSGTVTAVWELLSMPTTPTTIATNASSVTAVSGTATVTDQYREIVGNCTATGQPIASTDVSGYGTFSVQTQGGSTSNSFIVEFSNDNSNWNQGAAYNVASGSATDGKDYGFGWSVNTAKLLTGPVVGRYMRVTCSAYTSGTTVVTLELFGRAHTREVNIVQPSGSALKVDVNNLAGVNFSGSDTTTQWSGTAVSLPVAPNLWNGSAYIRQRGASIFKTATATASGDTAVWTPTTGKKFRLMGYLIEVTQDAATSAAGDIDILLRDATTASGLGHSVYVPSAAATTMGAGYHTGWVDLGNGLLSAAANNVLNVNLSAALTSGKVRVTCCGTEE